MQLRAIVLNKSQVSRCGWGVGVLWFIDLSSCQINVQSDLIATLSFDKLMNVTLFYRSVDSVALRSDCVDVHDDLELHCLHMAYLPSRIRDKIDAEQEIHSASKAE